MLCIEENLHVKRILCVLTKGTVVFYTHYAMDRDCETFLLILIVADEQDAEFLRVTCLEPDTADTVWNVYRRA